MGGNEGIGIVEQAGASAGGLSKGDVVVASSAGVGTWATHVVADAASLTKVDGSAPATPELMAACVAAPLVATHLLDAFGALKQGPWHD